MSIRRITAGQWIAATAAVALLVALFVGGKTLLNRFDAMERQMSNLASRVNRASQDAEAAAERASRASAQAIEASGQARLAAEGKTRAEEAKTQAEVVKAEAENRAFEAQQQAEVAQAEVERVRKEREQELNRMQQALNRIVETRRTALGLVMNLPEKALQFDFNSAELRPESRELLSRIGGILLASEGYGLAVYGHTDDVGSAAYNQQLSEQRAEAVRKYLAQVGIDPEIITIKGYGKSSPLANGTSDAERAKNRRVEIALTDTSIEYSALPPDRGN